MKRLSSFRPKGQERPGLAEAAGPIGGLHVNPSEWALAGEGSTRGSPNRSWGRVRSLGATSARRLLSGERLLPRQRGGGSGMVPHPPRHKLLKSSRLCLGGAEFLHYRANRFLNSPDCEMGASSRNTSSFSLISVRFSHK